LQFDLKTLIIKIAGAVASGPAGFDKTVLSFSAVFAERMGSVLQAWNRRSKLPKTLALTGLQPSGNCASTRHCRGRGRSVLE
jgi:hypothetical protein